MQDSGGLRGGPGCGGWRRVTQTQRPRHTGRSALGGGLAQPHMLWSPACPKYIRVGKHATAPETACALPPNLQDSPPHAGNTISLPKRLCWKVRLLYLGYKVSAAVWDFFFFNLFLFPLKRHGFL